MGAGGRLEHNHPEIWSEAVYGAQQDIRTYYAAGDDKAAAEGIMHCIENATTRTE
jgi:hypothetical protein